jgi:hypothetical protein
LCIIEKKKNKLVTQIKIKIMSKKDVKIDISGVNNNEEELIKALEEAIKSIKDSKSNEKIKFESESKFERVDLDGKITFVHRT